MDRADTRMHLVTVATEPKAYFPWLLRSCERFGAPLVNLGEGKTWEGFAWKFKLVQAYLETLPPEDIVCFIDGYDTLLVRPLHEMEAAFRGAMAQGAPSVIVARDRPITWSHKVVYALCFADDKWEFLRHFDEHEEKLVNSGTYIGHAASVLEVLRTMRQEEPSPQADDQKMVLRYARMHPDRVHVDAKSDFFLTLATPNDPVSLMDIDAEGILWEGAHRPCVLHGSAQTNLSTVIRKLGYRLSDEEHRRIRAYHRESFLKKSSHYLKLMVGGHE